MQEITIPDGHKATILGGTIRIEPIEPRFKRGDILSAYASNGWSWIAIYDRYCDRNSSNPLVCQALLKCHDGGILYNLNVTLNGFRIATPEEQQILFTALAKEGKYWDADAKEVKDFILMPESIGIYRCREDFGIDSDGLYIAFNNNTQLLYYNSIEKCWCVCSLYDCYDKVRCYLQPCKREDLKEGDTSFFSNTFRLAEDINSDLGRYVKVVGNAVYKASKNGDIIQERNHEHWWYKLTPINE